MFIFVLGTVEADRVDTMASHSYEHIQTNKEILAVDIMASTSECN